MSSVFLLLASVIANSAVSLPGVSTHRKTFEPRTEVRALFSNEDRESDKIRANADVMLKTKLPAINLINFEPIDTVQCNGEILTITFDNQEGAEAAKAAWAPFANRPGPSLAMIAAPQHGCGGTEMVGFMSVDNLILQGKIMTATQMPMDPSAVVDEYKLDVTQNVPDSRLDKRKEHTSTIPLNLNFDGNNVTQKVIPLFNKTTDSAECVDCHLKGQTVLTTSIGGGFSHINLLKINLEGILTANLGLQLKIRTTIIRKLAAVELFKLALPIHIGGLFEVGPKIALDLDLLLKANVNSEVEMAAGTMLNYPFKLFMEAPEGLMGKPKFDFSASPVFSPMPVKLTEGSVSLGVSLGPKIALDFKIFGHGFEFALKLENLVGFHLKAPGCKGVPLDLWLFKEHAVYAEIHAFKFNFISELWTTHERPLLCAFCNKCPDPHHHP